MSGFQELQLNWFEVTGPGVVVLPTPISPPDNHMLLFRYGTRAVSVSLRERVHLL